MAAATHISDTVLCAALYRIWWGNKISRVGIVSFYTDLSAVLMLYAVADLVDNFGQEITSPNSMENLLIFHIILKR